MKNLQTLTYWTLLTIGTHIGHSIYNSCFFTAWTGYICLKPYNLIFMNLFKSVILARTGFLTLAVVCENHGPIWFVDLDPINRHFEKYAALLCGEFNWQGRWAAGIISNFETFASLIGRLRNKARVWHNARQKWFVGDLNYWLQSRVSWPRYLFTQSVHTTYPPVCEAFYLGIPCFGVLDTNAYSNTVSIAFPGNDDSLECLSFYNELIVSYILKRKFEIILSWYYNIFQNKAKKYKDIIKELKIKVNKTKIIKENFSFPKMEEFHKHELYEMNGISEYKFVQIYPENKYEFNYVYFLDKWGILFKKINIIVNLFFYNNAISGDAHRVYALNRYFTRRCWLNKYFRESARMDSYNQRFRVIPKKRFKEGIPKYRFNYDNLCTKYLNYYISNRFSQYKALPTFNISVNGGNYYYFSKVSEFLGYPLSKYKKPQFHFHKCFNKWSKGNVYFKDMLKYNRSYEKTKIFDSKFVYSFIQNRNFRGKFINLFNFKVNKNFNNKEWIILHKNTYFSLLKELNYILLNLPFDNIYSNKMLFRVLIKKFVRFDNKHKYFYVNIELINKVKFILLEIFNVVTAEFNQMTFNTEDVILKYKPRYKYIGRRFIKKYFMFWKYKIGHESWIFKRKRKWKRFYSTYYRKWYRQRKIKYLNFKNNLVNDIKLIILNLFSAANKYNKNSIKLLIIANRLLFIKKIKKLIYLLKSNLLIFDDTMRHWNNQFDKKELLLLILYIDQIYNTTEFSTVLNKIHNKNHQDTLLFTNKIKNPNFGMNDICNSLVNLMHSSKGSGFWLTWDEFYELKTIRKKEYYKWTVLRDLKWDVTYLQKYKLNISDIFFKNKLNSIYSWRYLKILNKK